MPEFTEVTAITESLTAKLRPAGPPCLVVFYGDSIGRRHSLDKNEQLIGRSDSANITIDHNSVSRQHAKIVTQNSNARVFDLGSTNGTFVNDERIDEQDLRDGDLVRVGSIIFKYLSGTNIEAKYHEEIYRLTTIDGLTQTYNKRYFLETLERELNRALRYQRLLALVMFDIDHFKNINDTYGHLAGDSILRELTQQVSPKLRREDIFARYGGEEFALILPELSREGAMQLAEKQRQVVAEHRFAYEEHLVPVTISLGVTALTGEETKLTPSQFVSLADTQLYAAKHAGRNKVCG
jgi:two-component system, cell cycle response regulator